MLSAIQNYGPYAELATKGFQDEYVRDITIENWNERLTGIINIFKDGIETDFVQSMIVRVHFNDTESVEFSLFDYYFNLIMWYMFLRVNEEITPYHIFFEECITKKSIKNYIDDKFIDRYRGVISNFEMNNIIDDVMYQYSNIDTFSFYLCNTINLEDMIDLMKSNSDAYNIVHADLSEVPIENVKKVGQQLSNQLIDYIKQSDSHCLADCFRAQESVNPKQFKEVFTNIGSKPDGNGGIYPTIINKNFVTGGVNDISSFFIESSGGRTAQIIAKTNVGTSGHFARLLSLNNRDTILHPNPKYDCHSSNYIEMTIDNGEMLKLFATGRYYRFASNGMEYRITKRDKHLIGKTVLLRSPMTCASAARGEGICYKCYGDLAFANRDINIGQIASELLSSVFTQKQLSAKHLLEASVNAFEWTQKFSDYFDITYGIIKIKDDSNLDLRGYHLLIDPDGIFSESEEDNYEYNEYITRFEVMTPLGKIETIESLITKSNPESAHMYITEGLNNIIRNCAEAEISAGRRRFSIPMESLIDTDIFLVIISNNELSKTLNSVKTTLNKSSDTCSYTKDEILKEFLKINLEGGLDLCAVHAEVILSNQLRNVENILEKPDWSIVNEPYKLITLNQALTDNPSITVSLEYQKLAKALYNPLSFKKNGKSFCDLFFMEKPQEFFLNKDLIVVRDVSSDKDEVKSLVEIDTAKFDEQERHIFEESEEVDYQIIGGNDSLEL